MRATSYGDPSGEHTVLRNNRAMRSANSQPAISQPKTRQQHPFGNRIKASTTSKIQQGADNLYDVYEEETKLASAKERLR